MARKKTAIPRWIRWTPVLLAPLVLLNLCVAFFGNSLVFPLSHFFVRNKLTALGRYALHRPRCLISGDTAVDAAVARADRGTRLYNGKDYFTIYDFVKAHLHFSDPEWDGEPVEPEPTEPKPPKPHPPDEPAGNPKLSDGSENKPRPAKIKVKLADGKARTIQHMMCTTFWHPDGTPMSAQQFMELLFGKLPDFFKNEAELRALWSAPDTRKRLLEGLAEKGFGKDQLAEMQKIIDAERSDLFDVLAHVAYALAPLTREERAQHAKVAINHRFNSKQQTFLDFVLSHYVAVGVDQLDQEKLAPLLRLKYRDSIADAVADLGRPDEIGKVFSGFQKYLYEQVAA
jgi:type I restriction enzyme R subunit